MRFDSANALETFRELGDPMFAGPDGEDRVADFVAVQFAKMGLNVERREVVGSRFPQRVALWVGWPGYGLLVTVAYILLRRNTALTSILALILSFPTWVWLNAVVGNWFHLGRRRPPLETAPLVIASSPWDPSPPVRVVFQAMLGGLESVPSLFHTRIRVGVVFFLIFFPFATIVLVAILLRSVPDPRMASHPLGYRILMRYAYPGFLAFVWIGIFVRLFRSNRELRRLERSPQPERYGLSVLMEMAKAWPRTGSRSTEAIFVAAGGQRLDHAGSREIVRRLGSDWTSRPALLMLFFAPGAGEKVGICTMDSTSSGTDELAQDAGRSLWIPFEIPGPFALSRLWPFENCGAAIALVGSGSTPSSDDPVDPQSLHRAAQLATEIALRWARRQQFPAQESDSAT